MPKGQLTARLEIRLLGAFQVTLDGEPLEGIRSDKTRALLAYLAVEDDRPHSRQALATLLWGEHSDEAARASLRSSLSNLRQRLVRQIIPDSDSPLLDTTRHAVSFNADPGTCWLDVAEFDALMDACYVHMHAHSHRDLAHCPACIARLEQAVALYQGDFLSGLALPDGPAFDEWRVIQQERYYQRMLVALEALAAHYVTVGDYVKARGYVRQQLTLEPWREEAHRQLMRALALDGQRSVALAQYKTCRRVLADELGVEPAPETEALCEEIRTGELAPALLVKRLAPRQADDSVVWISLRPSANTDLDRLFNVLSGALDEFGDAKLHAFLPSGAQVPAPLAN
ncbi:MAG: BTAD domain-containing putative transcriptional regulator [Anaerolineae bacterium]|jgi:DNA-binding SARP family transcriptional activator